MKVRIKFSKQGSAKFIGHLDVMRYFQKVMRRADVAICYSGGFSPHQIMSFAAPLGVGITSKGQYLDIQVEDTEDLATMKERMNRTMAEGFHVESCRRLPDQAGNAMSIVAAAGYTLSFRPGYEPEDPEKWMQAMETFYGREEVFITKKTKKGTKELDLKPLVYALRAEGASVYMLLSAGSAENIKPELVLDAFYQSLGEERPPFAFMIQRENVYSELPEGEQPSGAVSDREQSSGAISDGGQPDGAKPDVEMPSAETDHDRDRYGSVMCCKGHCFISLEDLGTAPEERLCQEDIWQGEKTRQEEKEDSRSWRD